MQVLQAASIYMQKSVGWGEMTRINILVLFTVEEVTNFLYHTSEEACLLKHPFCVEALFFKRFVFFRYCYDSCRARATNSQCGITNFSGDDPRHWVSLHQSGLKKIVD